MSLCVYGSKTYQKPVYYPARSFPLALDSYGERVAYYVMHSIDRIVINKATWSS